MDFPLYLTVRPYIPTGSEASKSPTQYVCLESVDITLIFNHVGRVCDWLHITKQNVCLQREQ